MEERERCRGNRETQIFTNSTDVCSMIQESLFSSAATGYPLWFSWYLVRTSHESSSSIPFGCPSELLFLSRLEQAEGPTQAPATLGADPEITRDPERVLCARYGERISNESTGLSGGCFESNETKVRARERERERNWSREKVRLGGCGILLASWKFMGLMLHERVFSRLASDTDRRYYTNRSATRYYNRPWQ